MKAIRSMLFYIKTSFFFLFLNDELVFFKLEPMLSGYWKGRRRDARRLRGRRQCDFLAILSLICQKY